MDGDRTITRRYNTFQRKEVAWAWKPYIALGKISMINGDPASGKTTLAFTIGKDSAVEFLGRYDGEISPFDDLPGEDSKRENAAAIMLEMLADGPVRCAEIYAACLSAGIGERTVDTAKKELGVKSVRKGDGWYWAV